MWSYMIEIRMTLYLDALFVLTYIGSIQVNGYLLYLIRDLHNS